METQAVTEVTEPVVPAEENTEVKPSEETEVKPSEPEIKPNEDYSRKVQARIDKITREKFEAKARAERAEAELSEYRKSEGSRPARPSMTQFTDEYGNIDHVKYDAAVTTYEDSLLGWRDKQKAQIEQEVSAKMDQEIAFEKFNAAAELVRAKYTDFDEALDKKVFAPALQKALLEDQLAEVAYYLGKNENEALKLSQMPYHQMMRELGKLEGKLSTLTLKASQAPEPIRPVSGDKGIEVTDDSKLTDEQWIDRENAKKLAEIKKRLGG